MKYILLFLLSNSVIANEHFLPKLTKLIVKDPNFKEVKNLRPYNRLLKKSAFSKLIFPEVSVSYAKSRNEALGSQTEVDSQLSKLNLNYSLFSFGSDFKNFQSNKHGLNSFKANLDLIYLQREKFIAQLLLQEIRYKQSLSIQNEIIKLKENSLNIALIKFKRGSLSKNDFIRIKVDLINTKSEVLGIKQQLASTILELHGIDENFKNESSHFPWSDFFRKHGLSRISNLKFQIDQTPLSKKFKNFSLAQKEQANSKYLKHLGSFSLNYSRDLYQEESSDDLYGWSASLVYTLPLFENFDRHKDVQQARANARTADSFYKYHKNSQIKDVHLKKELLDISYQIFTDRLSTLKDSELLFKNVIKRFKKGLISVNDLFIEQDRLLSTKKITNTAIYNLHIHYLDFIHLHGKSVSKTPNLVI